MSERTSLNLKQRRSKIHVLINFRSSRISAPLRHALTSIGFVNIHTCPTYDAAFGKAKLNPLELVFFDAMTPEGAPMDSTEFVTSFCREYKDSTLIGLALMPTVENVFRVIKAGARGYIMPPFTPEVVEEVLIRVSEGIEIDRKVLEAENRNAALAAMVLENLDNLAAYLKEIEGQMKKPGQAPSPEAVLKVDRYSTILAQSFRAAKNYCEGGVDQLVASIVEYAITLSQGKTRLGMTREHLRKKREFKSEDG